MSLKTIYDKKRKKGPLTPLKATRVKCLDCMCYQSGEVMKCHIKDCSLWPYRFGKRPATAKRDGKLVV